MHDMWGVTLPVSKDRIHELKDGEDVLVNDMTVSVTEAKGHSNHHHVLRIGDVAFVGDVGGIRIPGKQFVTLPAPPPEFDLGLWQISLARLRELNLRKMYCTHFGIVDDINIHIDQLVSELNLVVQYVKKLIAAAYDKDEIISRYVEWYRERAICAGLSSDELLMYETANPFFMSVDGIMRYLSKI